MTKTPAIIGASNGLPVAIDLDALIGTHACAISNSGGGKSGLIRKIHEATHGMIQQILLDPEDDFYTLREKHDYVIAGGEDGDVPATLDNARALALATLTHGFSLIVQLNDLGADAPEFVNRFLGGLMSAPRELWHPVLVTIDELQRFASRDAGESIPAIKDLVFRGRKRGFTALFASLRMAEIDPGIRGMVNNWLLGRNGQALDRRTMAEQLGFSAKEGREKLATIEKRHFWAMGPAFSVEPMMFKVGDVETTPLRTGQARVATPPPPEAMRSILAGLAVEAPDTAEQSSSPVPTSSSDGGAEAAALRARVSDLEAQVTEQRGIATKLAAAIERHNDKMGEVWDAWRAPVGAIMDAQNELFGEISLSGLRPIGRPYSIGDSTIFDLMDVPSPAAPETPRQPSPALAKPVPARSQPRVAPVIRADGNAPLPITGAAGRMIDMLDRISPARVPWGSLAAMVGIKARGGNFNTARKAMRQSGLIVEDGDFVSSAKPARDGMARDEAYDLWHGVLTNPAPRMMDTLRNGGLTRLEIGENLGIAARGGNFNTGIAQLLRNGVAVEAGGVLRLSAPLPGERA